MEEKVEERGAWGWRVGRGVVEGRGCVVGVAEGAEVQSGGGSS